MLDYLLEDSLQPSRSFQNGNNLPPPGIAPDLLDYRVGRN